MFNSYVNTIPSSENISRRKWTNATAEALGARAFKFNLTTAALKARQQKQPVEETAEEARAARAAAVEFARAWAGETNIQFLCECHPGSLLEEPAAAVEILETLGRDRFAAILHTLTDDDEAFERDYTLKKHFFRHVHVQKAAQHRDRIAARIRRIRADGLALTWSIEFSAPVYEGADNERCFAAAIEDAQFIRECLA